MGAKVGVKKQGGMDEINVTPLIDIVLVLLIIFMIITPMTVQKMATELPPETDTPPPPPDPSEPKQLMVAIYADNTFALNLVPMTEPQLADALQKQLRGRVKDKRNVFVDAHPDAKYDTVVHVIDVARKYGAERVGFADLKEEGPATLTPEQAAMLAAGTLNLDAPPAPAAPATP